MRKRVGRGLSAGQGKTAGRGTKGQRARTGFKLPRRFEGGQSPFIMRLPKKKGFRSISRKPVTLQIAKVLETLPAGRRITPAVLLKAGLISQQEKHHGLFKLVGATPKIRAFNWSKEIKLTKKLHEQLAKLKPLS
jgi:large subunit ribosomal protein L15